MAENYHSICITSVMKHNLTYNLSKLMQYDCILLLYINPRKSRFEITVVNYHGIFNNIGPEWSIWKVLRLEGMVQALPTTNTHANLLSYGIPYDCKKVL